MVADFQTALIRDRTAEGMRMARTKDRLKGRPPKLHRTGEAHVVAALFEAGEHTTTEILFQPDRGVAHRSICRTRRGRPIQAWEPHAKPFELYPLPHQLGRRNVLRADQSVLGPGGLTWP